MIRKMAMLGLVAGFLTLGGCDLGDDAAADVAAPGAAATSPAGDCEDGGDCLECLLGGGEAAPASDAVTIASDAGPLTCPVAGGADACDGATPQSAPACCERAEGCASDLPKAPSVED